MATLHNFGIIPVTIKNTAISAFRITHISHDILNEVTSYTIQLGIEISTGVYEWVETLQAVQDIDYTGPTNVSNEEVTVKSILEA